MADEDVKLQMMEEVKDLQSIDLDIVVDLAERLDFLDIQILRKFYMTGRQFPQDTQPYCFPILFREMKLNHHLKIGVEALRKRLNNFVSMQLLEKAESSNPANYAPVSGREQFVKAVVTKFFLINGLMKFI
jgi:hypothetical protein